MLAARPGSARRGPCPPSFFVDALPFLGSTPIIFTTADGDVNQAVRLVKAGATDYVQKPYDVPSLVERLQSMVALRPMPATASWPEPTMVSSAMRDLGILLEPVAATNISALVTGESGSGKEVVVRHLHRQSSRAAEPFILVACASFACVDGERLLFGELFHWSDENRYELRGGVLWRRHVAAHCFSMKFTRCPRLYRADWSRLSTIGRFAGSVTSPRFHSSKEFWLRLTSKVRNFANDCGLICFIGSPWSRLRSRPCGIAWLISSRWSSRCCGI